MARQPKIRELESTFGNIEKTFSTLSLNERIELSKKFASQIKRISKEYDSIICQEHRNHLIGRAHYLGVKCVGLMYLYEKLTHRKYDPSYHRPVAKTAEAGHS